MAWFLVKRKLCHYLFKQKDNFSFTCQLQWIKSKTKKEETEFSAEVYKYSRRDISFRKSMATWWTTYVGKAIRTIS